MTTGWLTKRLGDVVGLQRGFDLPHSQRRPGDVRVLSAGVEAGSHDSAMVTGPGFAIGRATNLGRPIWSEHDYWPLNTTLFAKDFKGNHPRFLFHLFEVLDLSGFDSGSVQPMLNRNNIADLPVRIPDLATQTAIADVLGALDDKIAANERVLRLGDDFLRSRFAQLVHSAEDWVPLSHYLALRYGKSLPSTQRRSGEVPVVGSGGPSGMHDESLVEGPGIVVGRKGSIGTVWWCDRDFWPIDTAFFVEPLGGTGLRFAYSLLRWVQLGEHNGDSAVPGLNRDVALAQPVPRVAAELAEDFEALATPIMNLSQGLREETARLAATRDALLPELMSGRLTVGEVA